jgi:hypothetical protein
MVPLHNDTPWNPWKLMVVVAFLVLMACVGIAHVFNPDWFIERSGVRKGGEMLTGSNRFGFRYAGAFLAVGAVYMLYSLLRDYLAK